MNKCARMVLGSNRRTRTRTLMVGCNWLYFNELVIYHSAIQMYKIVKFNTPVNLRNKLTVTPDGKVSTIPGRLKISRKSFRWRTVDIWNELPDYIIETTKLSSFQESAAPSYHWRQSWHSCQKTTRSGLIGICASKKKTTFVPLVLNLMH